MKGKYKFIRWRYNAGFWELSPNSSKYNNYLVRRKYRHFKKNIYIFNTYFLYEKSRSSEGERED